MSTFGNTGSSPPGVEPPPPVAPLRGPPKVDMMASDVTLWYRRGLFRESYAVSRPTLDRADIVISMDTTGSMDPSIDELRKKCAAFSENLRKKALKHRFALIGFGDGDLPESALEALERALSLPLDEEAIHRFYLVTDTEYHEPTRHT